MTRLDLNTNGSVPLADTGTGAAGTVTGTERKKVQDILDAAKQMASGVLDGLMSAAHYALLAGATNAATANTLVKRGGDGSFHGTVVTADTRFDGDLNGNADTATALAAGNWYQSASTTIAQNSSHTFTHGLGAFPRLWSLRWGSAGSETSAQNDTVRVTQVTSTTITVTSSGQAGSVNVIVSALK